MSIKKISGKNILLYVYDDISTVKAYRPVACLTSNSLARTQEVTESDANKCEDETSFDYGKSSYTISAEGQCIDPKDVSSASKASYDWLDEFMTAKADAKQPITWKEATKLSDDTINTRYGKGIFTNLELTAPADGDATFSVEIQGIGKITKTDPSTTV